MAGAGGTYDRHVYMDGNGRIWFGVYNGGDFVISSATGLNDGAWHMAAATLGPAGMHLYVDGVQVATNAQTAGEATTGWWRVGCGNLSGWSDGWTGVNAPPASTTASNYVVPRLARRGHRLHHPADRVADRVPVLDPLTPARAGRSGVEVGGRPLADVGHGELVGGRPGDDVHRVLQEAHREVAAARAGTTRRRPR